MATGSDSERWGKLLTVGVALRTLPFFWYGIFNPVYVSSDFHIVEIERHKRRQETAACGIVKGPAPAMVRRRRRLDISKKKFFSSNRPRRPAEARRQDPALARATRAGR